MENSNQHIVRRRIEESTTTDRSDNNTSDNEDTSEVTVAAEAAETNIYGGSSNEANMYAKVEWDDNMKKVLIDCYLKAKGQEKRGYMKRMRSLWMEKYPRIKLSAQNLADNARRFLESGNGPRTGKSSLEWESQLKVELVECKRIAQLGGRGYMKRLKNLWSERHPELAWMSEQLLRDNAARFEKDATIMNLLMVKDRDLEIQSSDVDTVITENENIVETDDAGVYENGGLAEPIQVPDETVNPQTEITMDEGSLVLFKEIMEKFETEWEKLSTNIEREPLQKIKVTVKEIQVLDEVFKAKVEENCDLRKLVDMVYVVGSIASKMWGKPKRINKPSSNKKNHRQVKWEKKIKELKAVTSQIMNEIHRRKTKRPMSLKEKRIMGKIKSMNQLKGTPSNDCLISVKTRYLDRIKVEKIRMESWMRKSKRIKNNKVFQDNEGVFYRRLEGDKEKSGQLPTIQEFTSFWAGIWEDSRGVPNQPWMTRVKEILRGKIKSHKEWEITSKVIGKQIKKKKNWTSPGVDGIQNFWWKKLKGTWSHLERVSRRLVQEPTSIPDWIGIGRTPLIPKEDDISHVAEYRPITCLITVYKLITSVLGEHMLEHARENGLWDERQMGVIDGVLGTVDHLLVDKCVLEEVKEHKRNLNVVYYDYKKAYDNVEHEWMDMVFEWLGFERKVLNFIKALRSTWRTRLEVRTGSTVMLSRSIIFRKGFLQGDAWAPIGFCLGEIPIGLLLEESKGYMMGLPGVRETKLTHNVFIDDLKTYQPDHKTQEIVNEMLVRINVDIGARYGAKKCAEGQYSRGKLVEADGLDLGDERIKGMRPEDVYKFLGVEQGNGVLETKVKTRLCEEMIRRLKTLTSQELNDKNMMKAINTRALPVIAYSMNICHYSQEELIELDMKVKRILREKKMHGKQTSDERLYLPRHKGGRSLRSFRDIYAETKARVSIYVHRSENKYMKVVKYRELCKEGSSLFKEAEIGMHKVGIQLNFGADTISIGNEILGGNWKNAWRTVKSRYKDSREKKRTEEYRSKEFQSKVWANQDDNAHNWLKRNNMPTKVASIITVCEQMVETRKRIQMTGRTVETAMCRLCNNFEETIQHWLSGCPKIISTETTNRHDRALQVAAFEWLKQERLRKPTDLWYKESWERGRVIETESRRLRWDYEFSTVKAIQHRRPDLVLEYVDEKKMIICDMATPQEQNVEAKEEEKRNIYRPLTYELRIQNEGWHIMFVPLVIGCFGKIASLKDSLSRFINKDRVDWTLAEMQRVILFESESTVRKIMSGLLT